MPPFNWFNRGNKEPEQAEAAPTVNDEQKQGQQDEVNQDVETQQPAIAEDYLSWAKQLIKISRSNTRLTSPLLIQLKRTQ